jgi:hypothetical protein
MDSTGFRVGTESQHGFAESLAKKAGYASVVDACADALGRDPDELAKEPLSVADASRVIGHLKVKSEAPGVQAPATDAAKRSHYLTARHLRRIATGQQRAPDEIDEDAAWVLDLLGKGLAVRALFTDEHVGRAINGDQPIAMEHLLAYFKTWDSLAEAFRVTVPTAKAWGTHLPAGRAFEAEVRTKGYVRAPTQGSRSA